MRGLFVDIEAQAGEFTLQLAFDSTAAVTALLGPSGAGKSLSLRAIAGLLRPARGRIVLDGRTLFDHEQKADLPARARRVGVVFQGYALFPHLDVGSNIGFGMVKASGAERARRVRELARLVELDDRLSARPSELSGGQQQRIAIARALAPRPDLILLDEPFASVDPALRQRLREGLGELLAREGVRALLVTHDVADALALAERVVRIERGRVVATGGVELLGSHHQPGPGSSA